MGERRLAPLAFALLLVGSCAPAAESAEPLPTMRLLGGALLSELGPFHLRVFPKTATLRCDAALGQVLVNGRRDLAALPGRNVQPADRCGSSWSSMQAMYGTASPVDECMRGQQLTASVAAGTYVVLVHGQGQFRTPTGEMRSGIRGSGCAEVTLGAGATNGITVAMVEQADDRAVCGDARLDSNESCDLGMAMNGAADSECSAQCQTLPRLASNNGGALAAGDRHHATVSWAPGVPLVVGFDVVSRSFTDVRARYFTADGGPPTAGALALDVALDDGMGVQQYPSLAPLATPAGFVGAWESGIGAVRNVVSEAFENRAPPTTADMRYVSVPVAAAGMLRQQPSVAVAGARALVVWREGSDASAVLRAVTYGVSLPLGTPSAPVQITPVAVGLPRAVALRDGSFAVVWSAMGDVFARKVSSAGALVGDAVQINPTSAQVQDQPAAASLDDGLVVAWHDESADAMGTPTVRWARTGANLQRMGDAREAPTTLAGDQLHPTVAVGTSNPPTLLFAWEDAGTRHIRGRLSTAAGVAVFSRVGASTNDFQISVGDDGPRSEPSAAAGGTSLPQFAVAWEDADTTASAPRRGIALRLFPQ
jgi:hypothetical protein